MSRWFTAHVLYRRMYFVHPASVSAKGALMLSIALELEKPGVFKGSPP